MQTETDISKLNLNNEKRSLLLFAGLQIATDEKKNKPRAWGSTYQAGVQEYGSTKAEVINAKFKLVITSGGKRTEKKLYRKALVIFIIIYVLEKERNEVVLKYQDDIGSKHLEVTFPLYFSVCLKYFIAPFKLLRTASKKRRKQDSSFHFRGLVC